MKEAMIQKYKDLYEKPLTCEPLVQVVFPVKLPYSIGEALNDPQKMFENQMTENNARLAVGDDFLPTLRADFGTAQIPAMFGCPLRIADDTEPCCSGHIMQSLDDLDTMKKPPMDAGWMPKVDQFQDYFLSHKPDGVAIRHPDVQGPFNTAHLLRGNEILYDFYDDPEKLSALMGFVADFMVDFIRYTKRHISSDTAWFYDNGGLWRGGARMCNCSLQFISPALYRDYVMAADEQFLSAVGLGRIHYCGSYKEILDDLFRLPSLTNLELDSQYHDLIETCEKAPAQTSLIFCDWSTDPGNGAWYEKLLTGEVPKKKNIVVLAKATDAADAKRVYDKLKNRLLG